MAALRERSHYGAPSSPGLSLPGSHIVGTTFRRSPSVRTKTRQAGQNARITPLIRGCDARSAYVWVLVTDPAPHLTQRSQRPRVHELWASGSLGPLGRRHDRQRHGHAGVCAGRPSSCCDLRRAPRKMKLRRRGVRKGNSGRSFVSQPRRPPNPESVQRDQPRTGPAKTLPHCQRQTGGPVPTASAGGAKYPGCGGSNEPFVATKTAPTRLQRSMTSLT